MRCRIIKLGSQCRRPDARPLLWNIHYCITWIVDWDRKAAARFPQWRCYVTAKSMESSVIRHIKMTPSIHRPYAVYDATENLLTWGGRKPPIEGFASSVSSIWNWNRYKIKRWNSQPKCYIIWKSYRISQLLRTVGLTPLYILLHGDIHRVSFVNMCIIIMYSFIHSQA